MSLFLDQMQLQAPRTSCQLISQLLLQPVPAHPAVLAPLPLLLLTAPLAVHPLHLHHSLPVLELRRLQHPKLWPFLVAPDTID